MKRISYIFLFTVLCGLLSLLLHFVIEIGALTLIMSDFERYSLSPLWRYWSEIHNTFILLLSVVGLTVGFLSGRHYWDMLYK